MKIALICPANRLYMPYVTSYEQILQALHVDYDVIYWDRLQLDIPTRFRYQDHKCAHRRHFFDYMAYGAFVERHLQAKRYDKLIIFSIQLMYFLRRFVQHIPFLLDIRDYHPLLYALNKKQLLAHAAGIVVSSPYYTQWLPPYDYTFHHNIDIHNLYTLPGWRPFQSTLQLATIGATRDVAMNKALIARCANLDTLQLTFNGQGVANRELQRYVQARRVKNVTFTGRYEVAEEPDLYEASDFVSVLRTNSGRNNQTALPNRLYKAVYYAKPLVALRGSALAEVIATHDLGVVVPSVATLRQSMAQYVEQFDWLAYEKGRTRFLAQVLMDNERFKRKVTQFVGGSA